MVHENEIPTSCTLIAQNRLTLLIRNDFKEQLLKQGITDPQKLIKTSSHADKRFKGRGLLPSLPIQESKGNRMVAKQCLRGGMIQFLIKDIFWGGDRPLREMIDNTHILSRGIKTTEILAAAKVKVFGPFYRNFVFSMELPGCIDLVNFLNGLKKKTPRKRLEEKGNLFQAIARSFLTMHREGIYHRDLHLKNVLISPQEGGNPPDIYIIDFDKVLLKNTLTPQEKMKNLLRFNRSIEKYKLQGGPVTRTDQIRLLREYFKYEKEVSVLFDIRKKLYCSFIKLSRLKWTILGYKSKGP